MTHWQFLLQKEGEKSWLPLTTDKLAVEAGRYRLVAETSHPSTAVEVVINYCMLPKCLPSQLSRSVPVRSTPKAGWW